VAYRGSVKAGRDPRAEDQAQRAAWTLQDAMDYYLGTHATAKKLASEHVTDRRELFENHTPDRWKSMRMTDVTHAMLAKRHLDITGGITGIGHGAASGLRLTIRGSKSNRCGVKGNGVVEVDMGTLGPLETVDPLKSS
jgi:hypothetical protein